MMSFYKICICFIIFTSLMCLAQHSSTPLEISYKNIEIQVDGKLAEWKEEFDFIFEDTLGTIIPLPDIDISIGYPQHFDLSSIKKPLSKNKVYVKWFWNYSNLCFAFVVFDEHLYAQAVSDTYKPKLHFNDGIEIYIDSKNDSENKMNINDYQFVIDVGNLTDIFRGEWKYFHIDTIAIPKDFGQNILIKSSSKVYGTINDSTDRDRYYVIEVVIPFTALGIEPKTGMRMRLDLCCNDVDFPLNQAVISDYASTATWPFNWSGYSDFGYPKYWREIILVGEPSFIESISDKYRSSWLLIFIVTVTISSIFILVLFIRIYKLRRLPLREEISHTSTIFLPSNAIDEKLLTFNQKVLRKATDYIVANKEKTLNSEDVAKNIGISLRNFQRLIKEELHCTPTNFITLVKLNLAADFLSKNIGNVTDAAYEFGFSNPSYFSKQFSKHFGYPPSDHMKKNDKNID